MRIKFKQIIGFLLFSIAATGAHAMGVVPPQTTYFSQPSVSGVSTIFDYDFTLNLPTGKYVIGQNFPSPDGQDFPYPNSIGNFTGFYPASPSTAQLNITPTWWGGTDVQSEGGTGGIMINSDSNLTPETVWPTLFPVCAAINFDTQNSPIRPWQSDFNAALVYTIDLQVPYASSTDGKLNAQGHSSAAYATGNFIIVDTSTGLQFWYEGGFYDHRGMGSNPDYIHIDNWNGGTGLPIVNSVSLVPGEIDPTNNLYSTAVWGSAGFQANTWTGFRTLAFAITGQNLLNAINALKTGATGYENLSTNLANYAVAHINYNPEVYYNGTTGVIGTSFQNFKLIVASSLPLPFFRLFSAKLNRHFYTTSVNEAVGAEKSGFALEGNAGQLYADSPNGTNLLPLYRAFRSSDSDHFYTTSWAEIQAAEKVGYNYEFIAGYLPNLTNCSVNLYRADSPGNGHFYSTSKAEAQNAGTLEATYCINP